MDEKAIPLSSQDITETEIRAVTEVLRGERLALGPRIQGFETACADGGLLEAAARAGLAACMEASGDYLGAAEAYLRTAERDDEQPQAPHYMMQAGRCFRLAGEVRRAAEIYEQIAREYPNSAEGDRARVERAILARQEGVPE